MTDTLIATKNLFYIMDVQALGLRPEVVAECDKRNITVLELVNIMLKSINNMSLEDENRTPFAAEIVQDEQGIEVRRDYVGVIAGHWINSEGDTVMGMVDGITLTIKVVND